jgi:hypothetical protein
MFLSKLSTFMLPSPDRLIFRRIYLSWADVRSSFLLCEVDSSMGTICLWLTFEIHPLCRLINQWDRGCYSNVRSLIDLRPRVNPRQRDRFCVSRRSVVLVSSVSAVHQIRHRIRVFSFKGAIKINLKGSLLRWWLTQLQLTSMWALCSQSSQKTPLFICPRRFWVL